MEPSAGQRGAKGLRRLRSVCPQPWSSVQSREVCLKNYAWDFWGTLCLPITLTRKHKVFKRIILTEIKREKDSSVWKNCWQAESQLRCILSYKCRLLVRKARVALRAKSRASTEDARATAYRERDDPVGDQKWAYGGAFLTLSVEHSNICLSGFQISGHYMPPFFLIFLKGGVYRKHPVPDSSLYTGGWEADNLSLQFTSLNQEALAPSRSLICF